MAFECSVCWMSYSASRKRHCGDYIVGHGLHTAGLRLRPRVLSAAVCGYVKANRAVVHLVLCDASEEFGHGCLSRLKSQHICPRKSRCCFYVTQTHVVWVTHGVQIRLKASCTRKDTAQCMTSLKGQLLLRLRCRT